MKGFYKVDPRQVFTPDGFYPTGDIVRIEEDGHLFFQERRGDRLKTSGANVSRLEVEAALRALPEVALPIVVGLPDAEIGQLIVAAVVPTEGARRPRRRCRRLCASGCRATRCLGAFCVIAPDEVLWTPSNKVRLADMAKMIAARLAARRFESRGI